MSLESLLIHTCTIVRDSGADEDALGNPIKPIETPVYSGMCRLVEKAERVWDDERSQASKVTTYKLLLPAGTSVQERDRVKEVVLEDGVTLGNAFAVKASLTRRALAARHLSVDLERAA